MFIRKLKELRNIELNLNKEEKDRNRWMNGTNSRMKSVSREFSSRGRPTKGEREQERKKDKIPANQRLIKQSGMRWLRVLVGIGYLWPRTGRLHMARVNAVDQLVCYFWRDYLEPIYYNYLFV